ncbi:MAG: hypothetical protein Q4E67_04735, partial [Planctomycetia bacterium]|nr:hypothetical protein [Planctomycetia bacterium]
GWAFLSFSGNSKRKKYKIPPEIILQTVILACKTFLSSPGSREYSFSGIFLGNFFAKSCEGIDIGMFLYYTL